MPSPTSPNFHFLNEFIEQRSAPPDGLLTAEARQAPHDLERATRDAEEHAVWQQFAEEAGDKLADELKGARAQTESRSPLEGQRLVANALEAGANLESEEADTRRLIDAQSHSVGWDVRLQSRNSGLQVTQRATWWAVPLLIFLLIGCGTSNGASTPGPPPLPPPATRKWEGPWKPAPKGGQHRSIIYYGPWQCSQVMMTACQQKCSRQRRILMGCMWLADQRWDWVGELGPLPAQAGTRLAIKHCCCNYPEASDTAVRREDWDSAREAFRKDWSEEFGDWPMEGRKHWPGHHIHDLGHGGAPKAKGNVLPVPQDVHDIFHGAYSQCYKGDGLWKTVGPGRPYTD